MIIKINNISEEKEKIINEIINIDNINDNANNFELHNQWYINQNLN